MTAGYVPAFGSRVLVLAEALKPGSSRFRTPFVADAMRFVIRSSAARCAQPGIFVAVALARGSFGRRLTKPAYVYRPSQIPRRWINMRHPGDVVVRVPWGDRLLVDNRDNIGASIARRGVYELAVTEAIFRLVCPGDFVLDIGANLGYDTSVMAHRVGPTGKVLAFEPHPQVFAQLSRNVRNLAHANRVDLHQAAVTDSEGHGFLDQTSGFDANAGVSTLADAGIPVRLTTVDAVAPPGAVGLLKVDVEGHELEALHGALATLSATTNILFEEHEPFPTAVTTLLSSLGFELYGLSETLAGPQLIRPDHVDRNARGDAPTFLATRDIAPAVKIQPDGWRCLEGDRPWNRIFGRLVTRMASYLPAE
jgi:FkbM family methyltransferase